MAYLDDRKRVSMWIVWMAIPAIVYLLVRMLESAGIALPADLHEALGYISSLAMLSPLFALFQISMIVRGTAGTTWQNILCVVLTIAAAAMVWSSTRFAM